MFSSFVHKKKLISLSLLFLLLFPMSAFASIDIKFTHEHPLVDGMLTGNEAETRLFEFIREMNRNKKSRKSNYWIYNEFIDDIGTDRIKNYLEAVNPSCHGISHDLGKVIGEKEPELSKGMQICADTCTYACIHGVFKVYFNNLGRDYHQSHADHKMPGSSHATKMDMNTKPMSSMNSKSLTNGKQGLSQSELASFAKDVNEACDNPVSVVSDFFRGNCAHGVGHAMGMLAPDTAAAVEYCKIFPNKSMAYYCETGVFMEKAKQIKKQLYPKKVSRSARLSRAIKYCSSASKSPSSCLRFLVWSNRKLSHINAFTKQCEREKGDSRIGCFNALGFSSRGYVARKPQIVNQVCFSNNYEDRRACISGLTFMKKGHKSRPAVVKACGNLQDVQLKKDCIDQVKRYYYKLDNRLFQALL